MKIITLECDDLDFAAIQKAISFLQRQRDEKGCYGIPEGQSNIAGGAVAEVCRGYLEWLGEW